MTTPTSTDASLFRTSVSIASMVLLWRIHRLYGKKAFRLAYAAAFCHGLYLVWPQIEPAWRQLIDDVNERVAVLHERAVQS